MTCQHMLNVASLLRTRLAKLLYLGLITETSQQLRGLFWRLADDDFKDDADAKVYRVSSSGCASC